MRVLHFVALGLLWLASSAATPYETEPLLDAPAGPYRGTVVDEESKRPLPGALVLLMWQRPDPNFPQRRETIAAQDVMTDSTGQFTLDASALEARLVRQVYAPRIVIFKPAHTPYPRMRQLFPPGYSALQFAGAGAEVLLKPVTDFEDQAMAFNQFYEVLNSAGPPPDQVPRTWQVANDELLRLMAAAPRPPRPGGRP